MGVAFLSKPSLIKPVKIHTHSARQHRGSGNSAAGQVGPALPPASPSHLHPIPSPGSDFTSFDISTARGGGGEGQQTAEKPASNSACQASVETRIPGVVGPTPNGERSRGDTAEPPPHPAPRGVGGRTQRLGRRGLPAPLIRGTIAIY